MPDGIDVVFFQRKPYPFHKSVEYIFRDVRSRMPPYVNSITKVFTFYSNGVFKRLYTVLEAWVNQGDVNHITGDIHFAAILLKKRKTLLTVLDCGMLSGSVGIKHALLKFFWFTLPLKRVEAVTVISSATKDELIKYTGFSERKIHVVPVAISPAFQYVPKKFNKDKPVILQVGTVINKNLSRLLEAVKDVSCHLNIIGRLTDETKQQLSTLGISYNNSWDMSDEQLIEQYINCDILSFASTYEGFGMPIIEANAVGRPVVTSNILSMPEVAADAACLVDPFDVEDIRKGLLKVINDDDYREHLIQNGLKNVNRYNPQTIADHYLSLYKVLSGKHS